jgi:hypothetical protein
MTKDNQKLLVLHNFGAANKELTITDSIDKAIATSGTVQQKQGNGNIQIKLGGYSSVVLLTK